MNDTGIGWTHLTWNPVSGCAKISEGCKFCYAEDIAENKRGTAAFPNGFELTLRPHKLLEPYRLKQPSLIFVNSMSDLFWEEIPEYYRDQMLEVIAGCPQHQFQVLTKRPELMREYFRARKVPSNFWAGISIENQSNAWRADVLREVKAEIRFISAEPLLGPLALDLGGIHWLISGGESGSHLSDPEICERRALVRRALIRRNGLLWEPREDRIDWVRSLRDQCIAVGTKFFHKQWGGPRSTSGGRLLDGRTWDDYPRLPIGASAPKKHIPLIIASR